MAFSLQIGPWGSVFAVPSSLVDRHLKLAGKEQLQSILWMLRHNDRSFSPEDLAAALGVSTDTALDCIDYWISQGVLARNDQILSPVQAPTMASAPAVSVPEAPQAPAAPSKTRLPKPDSLYLAKRVRESAEVRSMMEEAQQILGGLLSPAMSTALLAAHDDLGLPVPVLVMLLTYAKRRGKANAHYIESMSRDWAAAGITTPDAADEKLRRLDQVQLAWTTVSSSLGLARRSPSKREEEACSRWIMEWHFSPEMIAAAYERCVDSTGKYSVSYMDKILSRWHGAGLTTPAQVVAEEQARQDAKKPEKTYQLDQVEEMSFFDVTDND